MKGIRQTPEKEVVILMRGGAGMVSGLMIAVILGFDFIISIWNAYQSGLILGLMERHEIPEVTFEKVCAYSGLGEAYVGLTYVLIIIIGYIALQLQYIDFQTFQVLLTLNFLVFGFLIIGFGVMLTVQSIIIAYKQRTAASIFAALYNTFAEVWDIANYIEGFKQATSILTGSRNAEKGWGRGRSKDQGQAAVFILVIVAMLLAFLIVHAAYEHGKKKALAVAL
ncbi:MAG: hypothetical protein M1169_02325 [Firmicutes bacterium]|nr:hypothetical protein [Bacillota bacterium]